jgi:hypothetical protein
MKNAVEIGSGAVIYIPTFIEIDSGTQKLLRENKDTHSKVISLLLLFIVHSINPYLAKGLQM